MSNSTKDQISGSRWRWFVLLLILIVALGLRLWGIRFGLPYIYHFDEHFYVATALKLGVGAIHNTPYAPTGFSNILFGEYAAYFITGKALGLFVSAQAFEAAYRTDPTIFYLLGRVATAVSGAATILILYSLGKITSNWKTGLIAAAFLAVSFLHVRDSHYAVPDVTMTFFVTLAVCLAAYSLQKNKRRYLYLAGLAGGLAIAAKWTALPILLMIWWAAASIQDSARTNRPARFLSQTVILAGFFSLLGFAIGSPQILVNPLLYFQEAEGQYGSGSTGGFGFWQVDTLPGWLFYLKTLLYGVGVILLALGIAGAVRRAILSVKQKDRFSILLLIFPVTYYLLMGSTRHYFARYTLPLIPFLALFAAEIVLAWRRWLQSRWPQRNWSGAAIGLLVAALIQPTAYSIRHDVLLLRQDTRTAAKTWIEANLPEGTKIAVDWETYGPPLSTPAAPLPDSTKVYDVVPIGGTGLAAHSLTWYEESNFDYLIATSFIYNIPLVNEQQNMARQAFYATLDREVELVHEFHPANDGHEPPFVFAEIYGPAVSLWARDVPGPTIKIYRLNK